MRAESNGNKYGYLYFKDYNGIDGSNGNVYFQVNPQKTYTIGTDKMGYLILEMDFNDFGAAVTTSKFFEVHSGEGSLAADQRVAASDILNIGNDSNGNFFYSGSKVSYSTKKVYIPSNEWVHIRLEFSILDKDATKYSLKCYIGDDDTVDFDLSYKLGTPKTVNDIRIGITNTKTPQIFGLDNITLYSSPTNIPSYDSIGSIADALAMKVGAENAKVNGAKIELANAPILAGEDIYCPVDAINEYASQECPAQYIVNLEGADYIHIDDIQAAYGLLAKSYSMGLILVGNEEDLDTFDGTQTAIVELMKTFVFDLPSAETLKDNVETYTNNYTHPYLVADADKFSQLRSIYEMGKNNQLTDSEDLLLYGYIQKYVTRAENLLKTVSGATPTSTYEGIISTQVPKNANYNNYNNNGYDNGGRVNSIPSTNLYYFAFAYQMTGHLNYARVAYDYSLALGEWNHWGPSHFLNCADAAAPFAIAYDWLYNAYKELARKGETAKFDGAVYSTQKIADIIFTHAIVPGYIQSNALNCPWPGSVESRYATTVNNWNAVCTSGMMAAALAIIGEEISTAGITFRTQVKSNGNFTDKYVDISEIGNTAIHMGLSTYSDYAAKLASMNMNTLVRYGLGEYAPDGSYVESPGYWTYGTNTFFRMIATLMTATGDDYGFMDCWGMDTTSYFAIHSESSDYKTWSYNDGSVGSQNSEFFMFVGEFYGDDNLVKVRKKQLADGKSYSLFDILFYNTDVTGEPTLATEYYMEGIDGYAVRSSWDKGAIYAGIMGGPNSVSHGHMDAGVFMYHNKGQIWFHDLGADQYNITYKNEAGQSKGYFSNYELYRIGAEGHNVIAITSEQDTLPYGQLTNADPQITSYYSSAEGGYAIVDLSQTYGTHVTSAKRGMLFTDSRSTVIIQDEFVFNGPKTAYWFGHYNIGNGYVDDVRVTSDGRTAFMISGDDIIRVSIVSDNPNLKFEIMNAYTYLLDITHEVDRSEMDQPNTEYNRDSIRKLAIKCENVETLNLAVVIEEVSNFSTGTTYTWTDMSAWNVDGVKTSETETKFKADYTDAGMHIGSVDNKLPGEFVFQRIDAEGTSYVQIASNAKASTSGGTLDFNFARNENIILKKYRYVVADFDIYTEGEFIDSASIGFNTSNGYTPILTFSSNSLKIGSYTKSSNDWMKISLIFDTDTNVLYAYVNNIKAATVNAPFGTSAPKAMYSIALNIAGGVETDKMESVALDNIYVRTIGTMYDDTSFKALLSSSGSLTAWEHNIVTAPERAPLAIYDGTLIYTAFELEDAIEDSREVSLLRDSYYAANIAVPVSVDTNGYKFNFRTSKYVLNITDDIYTFATGSIKVTWHIGNSTYTDTYTYSRAANFTRTNSNIGKITESKVEYADGGVGYNYYTTGWSNTKDGMYLSSDDMIVTSQNCEFWLVNNKPVECDFVIVSSTGSVTLMNGESELRKEIRANNKNSRVVLCRDMEILNTSVLSIAANGKNLYLNGHTLKHAQNDVHMFIFNVATANFNIYGPGNIVAEDSRTIFTSNASSSTVTYGIRAKNVNFVTNVQFADLRIGQHEFTDCTFNHTPSSSKTFLTIWDRNGLSKVTGLLNGTGSNSGPLDGGSTNLIKVAFDKCDIKAGNTGSTAMISYTSGTYSEVYFTDSTIVSSGVLLESKYSGGYNPDVKLSISGSSIVMMGGISSSEDNVYSDVKFGDGVVTGFYLKDNYIPAGAKLTNNYNDILKYKVATNYATVKWQKLNGTTIHQEYVAIGTTPKLSNNNVIEYLKSINGGDATYRYSTTAITSTGTVNLTPVQIDASTIFYSMNLACDFALEIYISKAQIDNGIITSVIVNNIVLSSTSYELTKINGSDYYKYRITRISPANACKIQNITVNYNNSPSKRIDTSAVAYLEDLINESTKTSEKILAYKTLKYIKSAYEYAGNDSVADILYLNSILNAYLAYDVIYSPIEQESASTDAVRDAIVSAKLYLSASARFRFKLNSAYTGEISISYRDVIKTYNVIDGKCNGYDYIELELNAAYLDSNLIITTEGGSTYYNLKSYYTNLNTTDELLDSMLSALNEYSCAAKDFLAQ